MDKVEIIRRPPQQEELSAQDNAPDNPFADRAELPAIQPAEEVPLSPEVAAHFGGLNPFAGGDAEPADVSEQAEPEDTVPELEPLPLPETTEEPAGISRGDGASAATGRAAGKEIPFFPQQRISPQQITRQQFGRHQLRP